MCDRDSGERRIGIGIGVQHGDPAAGQQGFEQAQRFSWKRTARQVLDAYEEIGSYNKRPR